MMLKNSTFEINCVVHTFKGHLMVAICSIWKVKSLNDPVTCASSLKWLEKTFVTEALFPTSCTDPIHNLHKPF